MIIGAGFAGLIAGFIFHQHVIIEKEKCGALGHRALLRFRSPAIGELTGIPFKKALVHKGIWDGGWVAPNIASCNRYAQKVTRGGALEDRSIWNIDSVERWVAPPDFRGRLIDTLGDRIHWGEAVPTDTLHDAISTIPLSAFAPSGAAWPIIPIITSSAGIETANVHQTVYFPDPSIPLSRASFVGSKLILEWAYEPFALVEEPSFDQLREAFGFSFPLWDIDELRNYTTQFAGKISPIKEEARKALISKLTAERSIYSLGRYATWRPSVMLDDIPHDCAMIKQLMNAGEYERRMASL